MTTVHKIKTPWERRDDEPDDAWATFEHWRNMRTTGRSLKRAAQETNMSLGDARAYHYRFEWDMRARHYDKWCHQHKFQAQKQALDSLRSKHAQLAQQGLKLVGLKLDSVTSNAEELEAMTWKDVTALFRLCVEIERVSVGAGKIARNNPYRADIDLGDDQAAG